jgi:protease-4
MALLIGSWRLLDFTRRIVVNLIFLGLVIGLLLAWRDGTPRLREHTALLLDPKGHIVEQYSSDAAQRALAGAFGEKVHEVQLRDILRAIDAAAEDPQIERIVLEPDQIEHPGLATLREIGAALERFKAKGKEVIAISDGMDQGQYYLAAHANRILLHPDSMQGVLLTGFGLYRSYFKDALDRLGVDVHLFRVGEYKSFAEPYVRNDASPEAREADRYWLNGVWTDYLAEIAAARRLDVAELTRRIDEYAAAIAAARGDLAQLALDSKLVDELATADQARDYLIARGARDQHTFRQIEFSDYAARVQRSARFTGTTEVAVVVAQGEILPGDQPPGTVGGESTAKLLRQAREDDAIKAVVLRVNSPGGDAFASELIRREVELTKQAHKPVVVSMGDVAASGGYWISMDADAIYAEPTTITGSIGIFGLFLTVPNTLAKIGVHTDGVGTTRWADALDPRRPLDPDVGAMIQNLIDKGYRDFVGKVAAARHKSPAEIDAVARGRVWSGAQARERGLVDELGGLTEAIAGAAERAHLGKDFRVRYLEKPLSAWERLALSFNEDALAEVGKRLLPAARLIPPDVAAQGRLLQALRPNQVGVLAYCFCELR